MKALSTVFCDRRCLIMPRRHKWHILLDDFLIAFQCEIDGAQVFAILGVQSGYLRLDVPLIIDPSGVWLVLDIDGMPFE